MYMQVYKLDGNISQSERWGTGRTSPDPDVSVACCKFPVQGPCGKEAAKGCRVPKRSPLRPQFSSMMLCVARACGIQFSHPSFFLQKATPAATHWPHLEIIT